MSTTHAPRRWPLALIASPAAVAVWSGWVGLGGLCGFGVIHPLPGIADGFRLNTAITLPVGVEAYGAYALGAWVHPGTPGRARMFARRSAIGALGLGMAGQVVYHLLAAAHALRAPWPVVVLVSCMPVITLGFGTALTHLIRHGRHTDSPRTEAAGTGTVPMGPAPYTDGLPASRAGGLAGTGTTRPVPAARNSRAVGESSTERRALPPPGVDRSALVAELAGEIRAAAAAGQQWRPDYEALQERTGFRRSWCEKAVRAARELAAAPAGPGTGAFPPGSADRTGVG